MPDPLSRAAVLEAVARAMFLALMEPHMLSTDWDNGVVLGEGNVFRARIMNAAEAALSALCELGGGREVFEQVAHIMEWEGDDGLSVREQENFIALLRAIGGDA